MLGPLDRQTRCWVTGGVQAWTLLSAVPLPFSKSLATREPRCALAFFPIIGAVAGGLAWLAGWVLSPCSPWLRAWVQVLVLLLFTGALHLDGLMDAADGLFGGRDAQQRLDIMKDASVGAFGVAAAWIVMTGKLLALAHLTGDMAIIAALWARWAVAVSVPLFPTAKQHGLAAWLKESATPGQAVVATIIAMGLTLLYAQHALWVGWVVGLLAMGWGALVKRRLGGHTGDTYGALIEVSELVVFLAAWAVQEPVQR